MRTGEILSTRNRRLSVAVGLATAFALVWGAAGAANGPAREAPSIEYRVRDPGAPASPVRTARPAKTAEARQPSSPGSAADKVPAVIRANRFELVDADGKVRATLKMEGSDKQHSKDPALTMIRQDGVTFCQIIPTVLGVTILSRDENGTISKVSLHHGRTLLRLSEERHTSRGTTHETVWKAPSRRP